MRNVFPDRKDLWVRHETVYKPINLQTNGDLNRSGSSYSHKPDYSISPHRLSERRRHFTDTSRSERVHPATPSDS